jgi:hypothetical protein
VGWFGRQVVGALTGPEMANNDLSEARALVSEAGLEIVDQGVRSVAFGYVLARKV